MDTPRTLGGREARHRLLTTRGVEVGRGGREGVPGRARVVPRTPASADGHVPALAPTLAGTASGRRLEVRFTHIGSPDSKVDY